MCCRYEGNLTFLNTALDCDWEVHLFSSTQFTGDLKECIEGDLSWVLDSELFNLNILSGDKIFLDKIYNSNKPFYGKFNYAGDKLISHSIY